MCPDEPDPGGDWVQPRVGAAAEGDQGGEGEGAGGAEGGEGEAGPAPAAPRPAAAVDTPL